MSLVEKTYASVNITDEWPLAKQFPTLGSLVTRILPMALLIGGIIFFIMIIVAGFGILMGAGSDNEQDKEKSKNFLTYGIIGLLIMFGAYWIMQIINQITGGSLKSLGF